MKYASAKILKTAFDRNKRLDSLTMRAWSEITGINSSTLNQVINSKILCPSKVIKKISKSLGFDQLQEIQLLEAYAKDLLIEKGLELPRNFSFQKSEDPLVDIDYEEMMVLKSWLHLAILELTTLPQFKNDIHWIAQELSVAAEDAKAALIDLKSSGFLIDNNGQLKKKHRKMRVPASRSREIVRGFHVQMLKRAIWELQNRTSQQDFLNRRITGYTVTANSKKISELQETIEKFILESAEEMASQKPDAVYQLQIQLFPLSKIKN